MPRLIGVLAFPSEKVTQDQLALSVPRGRPDSVQRALLALRAPPVPLAQQDSARQVPRVLQVPRALLVLVQQVLKEKQGPRVIKDFRVTLERPAQRAPKVQKAPLAPLARPAPREQRAFKASLAPQVQRGLRDQQGVQGLLARLVPLEPQALQVRQDPLEQQALVDLEARLVLPDLPDQSGQALQDLLAPLAPPAVRAPRDLSEQALPA